jgi:L-2-hydroxycarboxylate dehydrogenase (NAD+)
MTEYLRIPVDDLTRFAQACLEWTGMPAQDAAIGAENLVRADLRGIETHGVIRLAGYVRSLKAGRLNPRPERRILHESPATLLVDADRGLGVVASARVMDMRLDRIRHHLITPSHHQASWARRRPVNCQRASGGKKLR